MAGETVGIEAVVFDMGGVVVELGPISTLLDSVHEADDSLWEIWLSSPAVRDFEMGLCSVDQFGERLVVDLGLRCSPADVVDRFKAWPRGLMPRARDLVDELASRGLEIGLLSNTNELHWTTQTDHEEIRALFPNAFLSFELGMVKPDAPLFEHVVATLALPAESILFVDDNVVNVAAARRVGLVAEQARGVDSAARACVTHGLLDGWS